MTTASWLILSAALIGIVASATAIVILLGIAVLSINDRIRGWASNDGRHQ